MPSKNRTRRILAGLVVAHVVLNAVALAAMLTGPFLGEHLSHVFLYALFMLGPSQATLLALWVMLGGGRFLWRALPTVLGVILYLWCFERADREWRMITFVQMCIWGVLLLVARFTGLELVRSSLRSSASRPFQFYIRNLLMWTTALAIVLSVLRCLPADWLPSPNVPDPIIVFGSFALVAGAALYASLGRGWLLARILSLPAAISVGACLLAVTIHERFVWFYALLLGLMAAWLVGSLLLVRLAGYRLAWRWRFSRSGLDAVPPPEQDARHGSNEVAADEPT